MNKFEIIIEIFFYLMAFLSIVFALICIFSKKSNITIFFGLAAMACLAAIFFLLKAFWLSGFLLLILIAGAYLSVKFLGKINEFQCFFSKNADSSRLWPPIFIAILFLMSVIYLFASSLRSSTHFAAMKSAVPSFAASFSKFKELLANHSIAVVLIGILLITLLMGVYTLFVPKEGDNNA